MVWAAEPGQLNRSEWDFARILCVRLSQTPRPEEGLAKGLVADFVPRAWREVGVWTDIASTRVCRQTQGFPHEFDGARLLHRRRPKFDRGLQPVASTQALVGAAALL